jgi:hypothetical protein
LNFIFVLNRKCDQSILDAWRPTPAVGRRVGFLPCLEYPFDHTHRHGQPPVPVPGYPHRKAAAAVRPLLYEPPYRALPVGCFVCVCCVRACCVWCVPRACARSVLLCSCVLSCLCDVCLIGNTHLSCLCDVCLIVATHT